MRAAADLIGVMLLGAAVGGAASLAAIGFVEGVEFLNDLLLISPRSRMMAGEVPWLAAATVAVPALGGVVVALILRRAPGGRPEGPADAIRSVQTGDGTIGARPALATTAASLVSLGCGASVGQYGPLAYLGAAIGAGAARLGRGGRGTGTIGIGCGAAAAISTAFNAPIAGLLFAHEVILRHYSLRAFAPVTMAATVGFVVANIVFAREPLFYVEAVTVGHPLEFAGFVAIGVGGAFLAVGYMQAIGAAGRLAGRVPVPAVLRPALAGAALGLAALWVPDILGIGKTTLRFAIIEDAFTAPELALVLVAKLVATALCLGFGFAGGVFSPALLIGVLFGALVGNGAELVAGDARSALVVWAVCGMVAVTGPVIGAPLTTILIVFELTRNYELTTAAMVSVAFSNLVSARVYGRSYFDVQLLERGLDLSLGRGRAVIGRRRIDDHVVPAPVALGEQATIAEARAALLAARSGEACVVDARGRYLGSVTLADLDARLGEGAPPEAPAVDEAVRAPVVLAIGTSIVAAMESLRGFVGESIPVLDADEEGRLVGVVSEGAIVAAYLDATEEMRREEHA